MIQRPSSPAYLAGLRLAGRRVVVVGGGRVVARRLDRLLGSGADVVVVAPDLHPAVGAAAARGVLAWEPREYADGDLNEAWYVMAVTDDPSVNAAVMAEAERRRVFCVRADLGRAGSAVTTATGEVDGVQFAVLAYGDHHRSRRVRDRLLEWLRSHNGSF